MNSVSTPFSVELICVIVNYGIASKITKSAKRHGISGATISLGKGTANNSILNFMGLADIRKEIIYMAAKHDTAKQVLDALNEEFEFKKPNHGIAFTTSICNIVGSKNMVCQNTSHERESEDTMYHLITAIVDKGRAEDVVTAAQKAGSKGGTILNARGSGIHETTKLFAMDIEPEKEVVLILSEDSATESIIEAIRVDLKIDEPGKGIVFTQRVNSTYGIYK